MLKHLFDVMPAHKAGGGGGSGGGGGGGGGAGGGAAGGGDDLEGRELERKEDENEVDVTPTRNKCRHLTLTTLICASALTIALFVSKIQVVFQLMGGTTSAVRIECCLFSFTGGSVVVFFRFLLLNGFVLECKKEPGFSPRSSLALPGIPHNQSIFLTKFSCFFIFFFFF